MEVCFVVLGVDVVLAYVRYTKAQKQMRRRLGKKKATSLDERMTIEISMKMATDDEDCTLAVTGKLAANRTEIECEFAVLIEKPGEDVFSAAKKYGPKPRFEPARLRILENDRLAKLEVGAINAICDPISANPYAKWVPMLLAETAAGMPEVRFLCDEMGVSQETFDKILDTVLSKMKEKGKAPNHEQLAILHSAGISRANFKVIRGPPGCGKTTLMAAMAEIYVRASTEVGVLMCAPSNGNTHRIHEAVEEFVRSSKDLNDDWTYRPQRVYRVHLEKEYLLRGYGQLGTTDDEKRAKLRAAKFLDAAEGVAEEAEWYSRQVEGDRKKAMNDPRTGITAAVVDPVMNNPGLIVPGRHDRSESKSAALGVVPTFLSYLQKLRSTPFHKWKGPEKASFRNSWRTLARYVIGQKRIVVCTLGNTVSSLMEDSLAGFKNGILTIDETSLATDPQLWNAVVHWVGLDRTNHEFEGDNPVRCVVVVGDEAQGRPVLKSECESFNVFGQQLAASPYQRFVLSGFPVEEMWLQYRMNPALCEMPSQRWYRGLLRSPKGREKQLIPPKPKQELMQMFDVKFDDFPAAVSAPDRIAAEDAFLRLFLLDVPAGQCQVEPHTKSRFNLANVEVIVGLFKDLIQQKVVPAPACIKLSPFTTPSGDGS